MKNKTFFLILLWMIFAGKSLASNEKSIIYKAYLSNDMKSWRQTMDKMNAETSKTNDRNAELLNYEYGYIGWCIGAKKDTEAKEIIRRSEVRMALLERNNYQPALIAAYKSAFWGFQIGLNKLKAPLYGNRSINEAKKAVRLDPKNPYGYVQLGNIEYYMPPVFGGSKKKAVEYFLKAETLMLQSSDYKTDWNYLSLLTQIAKGYEDLKDYKNAEVYYQKILSTAPDFVWVKNELYPEFLKNKK